MLANLGFDFGRALLWIVLLPLAGALVNGVSGRFASRGIVRTIAVGSVGAAFLLALACFLKISLGPHAPAEGEEAEAARLLTVVYDWFTVKVGDATIPVRVAFLMDNLSGVMTLVVTGIGLLIHLYASEYMVDDPGYARFFTYLNLFTASMLILVLASNIALMFVGWEGVGLCSYLLIGYWWDNPAYAAAGKKAFVVNRIGDFGVLVGMFLLVAATASFEFTDINANATSLLADVAVDRTRSLPVSTATAAALFLFLGCTGKSAQVPLYVWLPDAMAGPTPVSALIHAATMVTAGVYLIVRLSPVFLMSPVAMSVIALVGAFTALLAASVALVQNQMKKILAYSTVSQLGFMFAGVGVGAFAGGFFHVFTHAFFKACLFLGAGSVMHAVHAHGDADVRELGGLRKFMPITHATFAISCLAIAGFPLTSGFFSKDDILLGAAFAGTGAWAEFPRWVGWTVFAALAIAAFMTAFYMFRMYFLAFWGDFRGGPKHAPHAGDHDPAHAHDRHGNDAHADDGHGAHGTHGAEPHESPWAMTLPLVVLAAGALLVGFLALPHWLGLPNVWEHWLEPVLGRLPLTEGAHVTPAIGATAMAVGTLVGLGGIGLAYAWYAKPNDAPRKLMEAMPKLHALLVDKWRVDELYDVVLVRPMEWLARFAANFDKLFVDTLLTKATAWAALAGGWIGTRAQTGVVQVYGAAVVLGTAVLTWWFLVPHPEVAYVVDGARVKLRAGAGLGYEYRFDVNSDGEPETGWTTEREVDGVYDPRDFRDGAAVVTTLRQGRKESSYPLRGGRLLVLDTGVIGPDWVLDAKADSTPATIAWRVPVRAIRIPWPERGSREGARTEAANLARQIREGADAASIARDRATDDASRARAGSLEAEDAADGEITVGGRKVRVPDGERVFVTESADGLYVVVLEDGYASLMRNGAAVRIRGNDLTEPVALLRPGEVAQVGSAIVRVGAVVRATVQVRNAFGYEVEQRLDIVVQPPRPPAEGGQATAAAGGGVR